LRRNNIENVQRSLGVDVTEIRVVAHGKGIGLVMKTNTALGDRIEALTTPRVKFVACENTMKRLTIQKEDLLPAAGTVDSGIAEVVRLQEAGWSYIKSQDHQAPHHPATRTVSPFVVSTDRPFAELMQDAGDRMHADMAAAVRTGNPDHDFVAAMMPHHEGAVNMAQVVLLYGRDPELQRLAKQIITDQQAELDLMRLWLRRNPLKDPDPSQPR